MSCLIQFGLTEDNITLRRMDIKVYSEPAINIEQEYDECDETTNDDWIFRKDDIKPQQNSADVIDSKISVSDMNYFYNQSLQVHGNEGFKTEFKQEHEEIDEMDDSEEYIEQDHDSMLEIKDEIDIEYDEEYEKTCYSCDKCDFRTEFQCSLQVHIDGSHSSSPNLELSANKSGKMQHSKVHGDIFKSDHVSKVHKKQCTGSKWILNAQNKYECQFCYKTYQRRYSVTKHIDTIHGDIKHVCELCHKDFSYKQSLDVHMKAVHRGIKFECKICHKTFHYKHNHDHHMKASHSDIKYQCETCQKKFSYKQNLREHMSRIHEGVKHECNICHKIFSNEHYFQRHVKEMHGAIKYECEVCRKTFNRRCYLDNHVQVIHDGIRHECDICQESFNQKHSLARHMKRMHNKTKNMRTTEVQPSTTYTHL